MHHTFLCLAVSDFSQASHSSCVTGLQVDSLQTASTKFSYHRNARDVEKRITTQVGQAIAASGPTRTRLSGRADTKRTCAWRRLVRARRRAGGTRASSTEETELRRLVKFV